jgi:P2 family phage contractile tail tube protein
MSTQLPYALIGFNVMIVNTDFAGKCEEVTFPSIEYNAEEILNAGMAMPIKMPTTLKAMDVSFKMTGPVREAFLYAGTATGGFITAVVHGHLQNPEGSTAEIVYAMRGSILKIGLGSAKTADIKAGNQTIDMSVTSLGVALDGVPLFTVDAQRGFIMHGPVEQTAAQRRNLKLG